MADFYDVTGGGASARFRFKASVIAHIRGIMNEIVKTSCESSTNGGKLNSTWQLVKNLTFDVLNNISVA